MGKAPRKQLYSKGGPRPALSEFDPLLEVQYNPASHEAKKVHAVKTDAENLANDLIDNNQIEELGELAYEKEFVNEWAKRMIKRGGVEKIKMNYINSALRICFKQIDMEKQ